MTEYYASLMRAVDYAVLPKQYCFSKEEDLWQHLTGSPSP